MSIHRRRAHMASMLLTSLLIPLLLIVAACDVATTSPATPGFSIVPPTATATGGAPIDGAHPDVVNCAATLPEMRGAQPVEILNTAFPSSGAAIVVITSPADAPLQIVRYTACMQVFLRGSVGNVSVPVVSDTSSPTAEVVATLDLDHRGWLPALKFPFDGRNLVACSKAQLCYGLGPQRYLELEQIKEHSHGVLTFVLRVASPQQIATCDPALFPIDYYPESTAVFGRAKFPLPPLTRVSQGYGDAAGVTTYFCSAVPADLIELFMEQQLPAWGWSPLMANGVRLWKFSDEQTIYMRIFPVTDPLKWAILTYYPGSNLG